MTSKLKVDEIATSSASSITSPIGLKAVEVFTSSGTWSKSTNNPSFVLIEVQGGGAGGARDATGAEQIGGSAGGYAKKLLDVSSITSAVITVGDGGDGAGSANNAGVDGGDSSWVDGVNTDVKGLKGVGGNTSHTRTIGGLGTGGDMNIQGGDGGKDIGHRAGSSQFGHGGMNWSSVASQNDATGYGAGGGAMEHSGGAGGDGTDGIVIVWCIG